MIHIPRRRWAMCLPALLLLGCAPTEPVPESPPTALEATILAAWTQGDDRILLDRPTPLATVEATYFTLRDNAPELYWVGDHFTYTAIAAGVVALTPTYLAPPGSLDAILADLLAAMPAQGSAYARAYALHDALAAWVDYGSIPDRSEAAYTAYGALIDRTAVCRGYAMAYLALLARAGIPAEYVASPTMNHGWVVATLDGRRRHIDVTWDDGASLSHRYFARTDAAMARLGYRLPS